MIHAWRRSSSAGTSIGSASASSWPMHVHPADLVRDVRGAQEPRATAAAVRAQRGRPLERRNGNRERAAPDRPFGRRVEERRGRLVGSVGRCRAMPGRPIEVVHDTRQAPCAARCSSTVARCWIADRMSGWRKRSEGPSTSMSRASTAGVMADAGTPAAATISETPSRSSSAAISRSHCVS